MRARTVGWVLLAVVLLPVAWLLLRPEEPPPVESDGGTANLPGTSAAPPPSKPTDTAELSQSDRRALHELRTQLEAIMKPAEGSGDNPLLQLPEHLQNAPEEEQRAYRVKLARHAQGMLDLTRKRLRQLEEQAETDPTLQAEVERTNEAIQEGERALRGLMNHLGLASDAG